LRAARRVDGQKGVGDDVHRDADGELVLERAEKGHRGGGVHQQAERPVDRHLLFADAQLGVKVLTAKRLRNAAASLRPSTSTRTPALRRAKPKISSSMSACRSR